MGRRSRAWYTAVALGKYYAPSMAEAIRNVVLYCLTDGQRVSDETGYIPLPGTVVETVAKAVQNIQ